MIPVLNEIPAILQILDVHKYMHARQDFPNFLENGLYLDGADMQTPWMEDKYP